MRGKLLYGHPLCLRDLSLAHCDVRAAFTLHRFQAHDDVDVRAAEVVAVRVPEVMFDFVIREFLDFGELEIGIDPLINHLSSTQTNKELETTLD